jgi:hypothetical protein
MKPLQIFSKESLERSSKLSPQEILEWLEEYRSLIPISAFESELEEKAKLWKELARD